MATDVYPQGAGPPLALGPGADGPVVPFVERSALDPATGRRLMFLAVVQLGDGCAPPAAGTPRPVVRLTADGGPATAVTTSPDTVSIFGGVGPGAVRVATASLRAVGDGVHVVRVSIVAAVGTWRLQLQNADTAAHAYVWAVADDEAGTRRPWLDAPAELGMAGPPGEVMEGALTVRNRGTGPLELTDADGQALGSGIVLAGVVPRVVAPNACATVRVRFPAPPTTAESQAVYDIGSDDTAAGAAAGHNGRVQLQAVARARPLVAAGDILVASRNALPQTGLTVGGLHRLDPATGAPTALVPGPGLLDPTGVDVEADGNVLVADRGVSSEGAVLRFDRLTARLSFALVGGWLRLPTDLAVLPSGDVLVLVDDGAGAKVVVRADPSTGDHEVVVPSDVAAGTEAIEVGPGDRVVGAVASGDHAAVWQRDLPTGATRVLASGGLLRGTARGPVALAVAPNGDVFAVRHDFATAPEGFTFFVGTLVRLPAGTAVPQLVPLQDQIPASFALAAEADGRLLVAGAGGCIRIDPVTGACQRLEGVHSNIAMAVVPPLPRG